MREDTRIRRPGRVLYCATTAIATSFGIVAVSISRSMIALDFNCRGATSSSASPSTPSDQPLLSAWISAPSMVPLSPAR